MMRAHLNMVDVKSFIGSFFIISEDSMTEEDEAFMLDNFVTFFIAGESLLFHL